MYVLVDWEQSKILSQGKSIYPAVNLRRNGLKVTNNIIGFDCEDYDLIYLTGFMAEWWITNYEVIDKPKFMLARIKLGL